MHRKRRRTWRKPRKRTLNRRHARRKSVPRAYTRPPPKLARRLKALSRSATGRSLLRRHKKFWRTPYPPAVSYFKGDKERALRALGIRGLMSMGRSDRTVIRAMQWRGKRSLKGKWKPYASSDGRRIILLSGAKLTPPFRKIGIVPETWYYPTKAVERLGTDKARTMWRHLHTDDGGKPPVVYADRNGKIDKRSNFVYGRGTYSVTDWIRR